MDNVFDILRRSTKRNRQRESKEKMESILGNKEHSAYQEIEPIQENLGSNDMNIDLGEDRDIPDYISDIERISLRELDKKPTREQLKVLKLEYNRLYDKILQLNDIIIASERNVNDLMITKREDDGRIQALRYIIRNFANSLPGNPELKDVVSKGNWNRDDVTPLLQKSIEDINNRLNNLDEEIIEATKELKKENLALKDRILKNQKIVSEIKALEDLVHKKLKGKSNTSNTTKEELKESSFVEPEEKPIKRNVQTKKDSKKHDVNKTKENTDHTEKHDAHFGEFFNEFERSYEKLKADENKKKADNNNFSDFEENKANDKHPLSPDYVETEKQEVSDLFDDNLSSYLNTLSDNQEFILGIIGTTGISRNPDLRDFLSEHKEGKEIYWRAGKINYQQLSNDVSELRGKNILNSKKLNLGSGGTNTIVYELSDIGKQCFKSLFNDNPVVPERKRIIDLHGSLEHGYLIKDSSSLFVDMGYKVYTDLKDVTVRISNNQRKVFDFVIEKDEKKMHIEVEMGTHNKDDFFHAMDKIHKITNEFYFICPNDKVKDQKTKQMFFRWVTEKLGGFKKANVILNITTINQLRKSPKHIWETTKIGEF